MTDHLDVDRRTFVRAAIGAAATGLVGCERSESPRAGEDGDRPPNVLLLAFDDLNARIGGLGETPQAPTPNFDRLAARGTLFRRAYCTTAACNPSRTSLLTGLAPWTSGIYANRQPWRTVMPDVTMLPRHFRNEGYRSIGAGKVFHGWFPDAASWDEQFEVPAPPAPASVPLLGPGDPVHLDWGPLDVEPAEMVDARIAARLAEHLGRLPEDEPFFLAGGFYRPHLPWYLPRAWFDRIDPAAIELPPTRTDDLDDVPATALRWLHPEPFASDPAMQRAGIAAYLASIAFVDSCLGRVLDALDRRADAARTIVVAWSDHGFHLGEKNHWRKFTLWEPATRVPLIVADPRIGPGGPCDQPVSLVDLYPTLLELCDLSAPAALDGSSLCPLLADPSSMREAPAIMSRGRGNYAVRSHRHRYIRYATGDEELYDHDADPHEWNNIAASAEAPAIKTELARWIPREEAPEAPSETKRPEGLMLPG